jgi:putative endonuclease
VFGGTLVWWMRYVYILRSINWREKTYVGLTKDPSLRLKRHNWGECAFTCKFRPWEIVFLEGFENDNDAVLRERQLKGWSRRKKEALIRGDFVELKGLAKRRG